MTRVDRFIVRKARTLTTPRQYTVDVIHSQQHKEYLDIWVFHISLQVQSQRERRTEFNKSIGVNIGAFAAACAYGVDEV